MKVTKVQIKRDNKQFGCVEFVFNFIGSDKFLLTKINEEAEQLASSVNTTAARDASISRTPGNILSNCIAGILSEYCWRYWLNEEANRLGLNISAVTTVFKSQNNQIDISVEYFDKPSRTAEVRSSFPYTGIENAVCNVFDIIGWYVNPVKIAEVKKDYYLRVLYPYNIKYFFDRLKADNFSVFLTGGATRKLLETSSYAKNKHFIPYDDISARLSSKSGLYKVIEPIFNAYDTDKITEKILKGLND